MGPKFTEGAITQHLAKLRGIMQKTGIPVPPSLKRGMVSRTPSKVYANANNKHSFDEITPMHPGTPQVPDVYKSIYDSDKGDNVVKTEEDTPVKPKPKARSRAKGKGRARMSEEDDDEDEAAPELYDSEDGDYAAPKKRRRPTKATVRGRQLAGNPPSTPPSQVIKTEDAGQSSATALTGGSTSSHLGSPGPSRRTRGIKRDYSLMAAIPSESGDEEAANEESVSENAGDTGAGGGSSSSEEEEEEEETEIYIGDAGEPEVKDDIVLTQDFIPGVDPVAGAAAADDLFTPTGALRVADFPYGQIQMQHLVPSNNSLVIDHNVSLIVGTLFLFVTDQASRVELFPILRTTLVSSLQEDWERCHRTYTL